MAILKKLTTVSNARWLYQLITAYVDEAEKFAATGRPSGAASERLPLSPGQRFRFFGFVAAGVEAERARTKRARTDLQHCAAWWLPKTAGWEKKAMHIMLSLPPDLGDKLERAGLSSGEELFSCLEGAMEGFRKQFFPKDELGFVAGLHREKKHKHLHVLLFPQTRSGVPINLSRLADVKLEGTVQRLDFQGCLQERFEREVGVLLTQVDQVERNLGKDVWAARTISTVQTLIGAQERSAVPVTPEDAVRMDRSIWAGPDLAKAAEASIATYRDRVRHEARVLAAKPQEIAPAAANLARNAGRLRGEADRKNVESYPALGMRTMRLAARALEVSAAALGRDPDTLRLVRTPENFTAADRLRETTELMNEHLRRERHRQAVQPLHTLVNRDLNPHRAAGKLEPPVPKNPPPSPSLVAPRGGLVAINLRIQDGRIELDLLGPDETELEGPEILL